MNKRMVLVIALLTSTTLLSGCGSVGDQFKGFLKDSLERSMPIGRF